MQVTRELTKYRDAKQCIMSGTPSLAAIIRSSNKETLEDYLVLWLVSINQKLNLLRPMPEGTLQETAHYLYTTYPYMTMADINLVFTRAITGKLGKMFESLSMAKVLTWFEEYAEERMEVAASLSMREHERYTVPNREKSLKDENKMLSHIAAGLASAGRKGGDDGEE